MEKNIEKKENSGLTTILAVLGLILGIIGLLGSFIPCIGILALYISIPAVLVSGSSLFLAYQRDGVVSFSMAALIVSVIGLTISALQYYTASSVVNETGKVIKSILK